MAISYSEYEDMAHSAVELVSKIESSNIDLAYDMFEVFDKEYALLGKELDALYQFEHKFNTAKWFCIGKKPWYRSRINSAIIDVAIKTCLVRSCIRELENAAKAVKQQELETCTQDTKYATPVLSVVGGRSFANVGECTKSIPPRKPGAEDIVFSYLCTHPPSTDVEIMDNLRELCPSHIMGALWRLCIDAKIHTDIGDYYEHIYSVRGGSNSLGTLTTI